MAQELRTLRGSSVFIFTAAVLNTFSGVFTLQPVDKKTTDLTRLSFFYCFYFFSKKAIRQPQKLFSTLSFGK